MTEVKHIIVVSPSPEAEYQYLKRPGEPLRTVPESTPQIIDRGSNGEPSSLGFNTVDELHY